MFDIIISLKTTTYFDTVIKLMFSFVIQVVYSLHHGKSYSSTDSSFVSSSVIVIAAVVIIRKGAAAGREGSTL